MANQQASFRPSDVQVGDVVGTLLMLSTEMVRPGKRQWSVRCVECGRERSIRSDHLIRYANTDCRCRPNKRHGLSREREYRIWTNMVIRCHTETADNFPFYGGLGRYVCDGWRYDVKRFIDDMGPAPTSRHSIDRIDTNGSYTCGACDHCISTGSPANCRWATKEEQVRNASNNRYYTHSGQTLILKDWARAAGISYFTLHSRLKRGWPFAAAIETPKLTNWLRGRGKISANLPDGKSPPR